MTKLKDFPGINVTLGSVSNSNPTTHTIYLHMNDIDITDSERIKLVSDTIIHEHIHIILNDMFPGSIVTYLFDAIGDKLRLHLKLKEQTTRTKGCICWGQFITKYGIDGLIDNYDLDRKKVKKVLKDGV